MHTAAAWRYLLLWMFQVCIITDLCDGFISPSLLSQLGIQTSGNSPRNGQIGISSTRQLSSSFQRTLQRPSRRNRSNVLLANTANVGSTIGVQNNGPITHNNHAPAAQTVARESFDPLGTEGFTRRFVPSSWNSHFPNVAPQQSFPANTQTGTGNDDQSQQHIQRLMTIIQSLQGRLDRRQPARAPVVNTRATVEQQPTAQALGIQRSMPATARGMISPQNKLFIFMKPQNDKTSPTPPIAREAKPNSMHPPIVSIAEQATAMTMNHSIFHRLKTIVIANNANIHSAVKTQNNAPVTDNSHTTEVLPSTERPRPTSLRPIIHQLHTDDSGLQTALLVSNNSTNMIPKSTDPVHRAVPRQSHITTKRHHSDQQRQTQASVITNIDSHVGVQNLRHPTENNGGDSFKSGSSHHQVSINNVHVDGNQNTVEINSHQQLDVQNVNNHFTRSPPQNYKNPSNFQNGSNISPQQSHDDGSNFQSTNNINHRNNGRFVSSNGHGSRNNMDMVQSATVNAARNRDNQNNRRNNNNNHNNNNNNNNNHNNFNNNHNNNDFNNNDNYNNNYNNNNNNNNNNFNSHNNNGNNNNFNNRNNHNGNNHYNNDFNNNNNHNNNNHNNNKHNSNNNNHNGNFNSHDDGSGGSINRNNRNFNSNNNFNGNNNNVNRHNNRGNQPRNRSRHQSNGQNSHSKNNVGHPDGKGFRLNRRNRNFGNSHSDTGNFNGNIRNNNMNTGNSFSKDDNSNSNNGHMQINNGPSTGQNFNSNGYQDQPLNHNHPSNNVNTNGPNKHSNGPIGFPDEITIYNSQNNGNSNNGHSNVHNAYLNNQNANSNSFNRDSGNGNSMNHGRNINQNNGPRNGNFVQNIDNMVNSAPHSDDTSRPSNVPQNRNSFQNGGQINRNSFDQNMNIHTGGRRNSESFVASQNINIDNTNVRIDKNYNGGNNRNVPEHRFRNQDLTFKKNGNNHNLANYNIDMNAANMHGQQSSNLNVNNVNVNDHFVGMKNVNINNGNNDRHSNPSHVDGRVNYQEVINTHHSIKTSQDDSQNHHTYMTTHSPHPGYQSGPVVHERIVKTGTSSSYSIVDDKHLNEATSIHHSTHDVSKSVQTRVGKNERGFLQLSHSSKTPINLIINNNFPHNMMNIHGSHNDATGTATSQYKKDNVRSNPHTTATDTTINTGAVMVPEDDSNYQHVNNTNIPSPGHETHHQTSIKSIQYPSNRVTVLGSNNNVHAVSGLTNRVQSIPMSAFKKTAKPEVPVKKQNSNNQHSLLAQALLRQLARARKAQLEASSAVGKSQSLVQSKKPNPGTFTRNNGLHKERIPTNTSQLKAIALKKSNFRPKSANAIPKTQPSKTIASIGSKVQTKNNHGKVPVQTKSGASTARSVQNKGNIQQAKTGAQGSTSVRHQSTGKQNGGHQFHQNKSPTQQNKRVNTKINSRASPPSSNMRKASSAKATPKQTHSTKGGIPSHSIQRIKSQLPSSTQTAAATAAGFLKTNANTKRSRQSIRTSTGAPNGHFQGGNIQHTRNGPVTPRSQSARGRIPTLKPVHELSGHSTMPPIAPHLTLPGINWLNEITPQMSLHSQNDSVKAQMLTIKNNLEHNSGINNVKDQMPSILQSNRGSHITGNRPQDQFSTQNLHQMNNPIQSNAPVDQLTEMPPSQSDMLSTLAQSVMDPPNSGTIFQQEGQVIIEELKNPDGSMQYTIHSDNQQPPMIFNTGVNWSAPPVATHRQPLTPEQIMLSTTI